MERKIVVMGGSFNPPTVEHTRLMQAADEAVGAWKGVFVPTARAYVAELQEMLLATGGKVLVEGNRWDDTFWGVVVHTGQDENLLGRILMRIRDELRGQR